MKISRQLGMLAAGMALALVAGASQAVEYQFHHKVKGIVPAASSQQPEVDWSLAGAVLPRAIYNEPYSFSLTELVTPEGLSGFGWSAQGLPSWATLNIATGEITGTPSTADAGAASVTVTASRKDVSDQEVYTLEVGGVVLQAAQVSVGLHHSCALTAGGGVKCWGYNAQGQLGDGTKVTPRTRPVDVVGLQSGVASVHAGQYHTCAILIDGSAKCWGKNGYGQVGNGTSNPAFTPQTVTVVSEPIASISGGDNHTCALTQAGGAKCWGMNTSGQLGNNSTASSFAAVTPVGLGAGVEQIASGQNYTCAVTSAGGAKCWGENSVGQLGTGLTSGSLVPRDVKNLTSGVASISATHRHTCAVTTEGVAKCWGSGGVGSLGNGSTSDSSVPRDVLLAESVRSISAGYLHSCAITQDDVLKCWGRQLDIGSIQNSNVTAPQDATIGPVKQVSNGYHGCAVTTTGVTKCWGYGAAGSIGDGATVNRVVPVEVLPSAAE